MTRFSRIYTIMESMIPHPQIFDQAGNVAIVHSDECEQLDSIHHHLNIIAVSSESTTLGSSAVTEKNICSDGANEAANTLSVRFHNVSFPMVSMYLS